MTSIDRRSFLRHGAAVSGAAIAANTLFQTLDSAAGANSPAATGPASKSRSGDGGYGPLTRVADQNGAEILALPAGFTYTTFSKIGDPMSDGGTVPLALDGMGSFPGPQGTTLLIRNHEVRTAAGDATGGVAVPVDRKYDPMANGGTTSLLLDHRRGRLLRDWASFGGSIVNCAGGIAYREVGWITSEESVNGPNQGFAKTHGYNFLVPATTDGPTAAAPLKAMGRFAHEAVAVDPRTGIVYETEDSGNDSGLYRFLPVDPSDLTMGGKLQMLAVRGQDNYNALTGQKVGQALPVRWVDINDPDPDLEGGAPEVAAQGTAQGAAAFNRLEGIWWDASTQGVYFNSTSGGDAGYGQVWHYEPKAERLTLFFESPGGTVLDSPDNLLVTPRGGILLCEDDATSRDDDTHPLAGPDITDVNRLIGINKWGEAFEFAVNILNDAELAGACYSPDGQVLFVNIFGDGNTAGSGMTCAVSGPWGKGAL